jgi:hypothetical protein
MPAYREADTNHALGFAGGVFHRATQAQNHSARITAGGRHAANPREAAVSPPAQASPLKATHRTPISSDLVRFFQELQVKQATAILSLADEAC